MTDFEDQLIQAQISLANEQLAAIQNQAFFNEDIELQLTDLLNLESDNAAAAITERERLRPIQDALISQQLQLIQSGGAASPEQIDLINQAGDAALASGESDISAFLQESLGLLTNELAPSLGLRPTDTPIIDRGGRIAAEAVRQQGQLANSIAGQTAEATLNFPLQANQLQSSIIGQQQGLTNSLQQFQDTLRQQAFQNRLSLTSQSGGFGLGLATGFQPNLAGSSNALAGITAAGVPSTSFTNSSSDFGIGDFGSLACGIGGLLTGLNNLLPSSRELKTDKTPVDEGAILEMIKKLPVEAWRYRPELGDDAVHIGTYAEDFAAAFGLGDGVTISTIDAIGTTMAAIQALARKVEKIEEAGFGLD